MTDQKQQTLSDISDRLDRCISCLTFLNYSIETFQDGFLDGEHAIDGFHHLFDAVLRDLKAINSLVSTFPSYQKKEVVSCLSIEL